MGLGDEIMATGHAREVYNAQQRPGGERLKVRIRDAAGNKRWSDLWSGNPVIAGPQDHGATISIQDGPGCRPYIAYPFTKETGWRYSGWRASDHRGEIFLTAAERTRAGDIAAGGPFVLVEPNIARKSSTNRRWPWGSFVEVVRANPKVRFVQPIYASARPLPGVEPIGSTFREACAILARARLYLGAEGGFVHAAAALRVSAVVIFGGCIDAESLGYPEHTNIVADTPGTPCGRWKHCEHCVTAMESITPERVSDEVRELLGAHADAVE